MTRKEEIINYANSFKGKDIENEELKDTIRLAIIDGALWADKTMIEKACEWLESVNLDYYQIREGVFSRELVDDFRKAMEE